MSEFAAFRSGRGGRSQGQCFCGPAGRFFAGWPTWQSISSPSISRKNQCIEPVAFISSSYVWRPNQLEVEAPVPSEERPAASGPVPRKPRWVRASPDSERKTP